MKHLVGDSCWADKVRGRNMTFLSEADDLQWVRDVHLTEAAIVAAYEARKQRKLNGWPKLTPQIVTGVILTGNEDSPDSLWVTTDERPNHITAVYWRIL